MSKRRKTVLLVLLLAALIVGSKALGLDAWLSVGRLRSTMDAAGPIGVFGFWAAFAVATLLAVPALVFILAALAAYGPVVGLPVAFVGSLLAATVTFLGIRCTGSDAPAEQEPPASGRLARAMSLLSSHPVAVVAGLRSLLLLSAPLNLALALSSIRYRDYIVGTAVGLVPPLLVYGATLECWLG